MISISKIKVGSCNVKESLVIKGGRKITMEFPVNVYLIQHPECGPILVDGGFDKGIHKKYLYKKVLGVVFRPKDSLELGLEKLGYRFEDIKTLIITHFHEDHIGNLPQLKHATVYTHSAYCKRKELKEFSVLRAVHCKDYFEDIGFYGEKLCNGIRLINLEGHAKGMLGLVLDKKRLILASDAGWRHDWLSQLSQYTALAKLIQYNFRQYLNKLEQLQTLMDSGWKVEFNHDGGQSCIES